MPHILKYLGSTNWCWFKIGWSWKRVNCRNMPGKGIWSKCIKFSNNKINDIYKLEKKTVAWLKSRKHFPSLHNQLPKWAVAIWAVQWLSRGCKKKHMGIHIHPQYHRVIGRAGIDSAMVFGEKALMLCEKICTLIKLFLKIWTNTF